MEGVPGCVPWDLGSEDAPRLGDLEEGDAWSEGHLDYATWQMRYSDIWAHQQLRFNQAYWDYYLRSSPHYLDRERFERMAMPTDEEKAKHRQWMAVKPSDGDDFSYDLWLGQHRAIMMLYGHAEQPQGLIGQEDSLWEEEKEIDRLERRPTMDLEEPGTLAGTSGTWHIEVPKSDARRYGEADFVTNPAERAILEMHAESRPEVRKDGAFASWSEVFHSEVVAEGDLGGLEEDWASHGLSKNQEWWFQHLLDIRPEAVGPVDSADWLGRYVLLLFGLVHSSDGAVPGYVRLAEEQLAWFEKSKPERIVGAEAYDHWLTRLPDIAGHPAALEKFMSVKPAALDEDDLEEMHEIFAALPSSTPHRDQLAPRLALMAPPPLTEME
jgi:hypothetical protein